MIIPLKDFGPHCTVEIRAYHVDGYRLTTVYADNIIEGMELADEFFKLNDAPVEVCEMQDGRWKLSYTIEPYRGYIKMVDEIDAQQAELWLSGVDCLV